MNDKSKLMALNYKVSEKKKKTTEENLCNLEVNKELLDVTPKLISCSSSKFTVFALQRLF